MAAYIVLLFEFVVTRHSFLVCQCPFPQDHPQIGADIQERTGYFFRVKAEPTDLKFSMPPAGSAPLRPPPPNNPAPQSNKAGRSNSSNDSRGKLPKLFQHRHGGGSSKGGFV